MCTKGITTRSTSTKSKSNSASFSSYTTHLSLPVCLLPSMVTRTSIFFPDLYSLHIGVIILSMSSLAKSL